MSVTKEEIAAAADLFSDLGDITTRRMMGGACLYCDGTIFAIVHPEGGTLMKAQGAFIDKMRDMGQSQWTYSRDGGPERAMPYWTLPDEALDDPELACDLAREALRHLE